jgi:hypothetical protein
MVGKHVAEFQQELTLARIMCGCVGKSCPMPYGYPLRVYSPHHVCRSPKVKPFLPRGGFRSSNGVPMVLRLKLAGDYVLGLYNPEPQ